MIFALILTVGCKKKVAEQPPPPPPPPEKISETKFLLGLGEKTDVKNLKLGDSLVVSLNPDQILSPSARFVVVKPFEVKNEYYELLALVKKIPLSVVWVGKEGSQLLIQNYSDMLENYNASEKFLLLDPKPAYYLSVGTNEYWVSKDGKFWKKY